MLDHYGFRGISNPWFENYLKGRKQFTLIKSVNSSLEVSQGSILGLILFLILKNYFPNASKLFTILFADAITLQYSSENLKSL